MNILTLNKLIQQGKFHHATYRNIGTLWEGLWIYQKYAGLRGFEPVGFFAKGSEELEQAENRLRDTGISVGSFGQG